MKTNNVANLLAAQFSTAVGCQPRIPFRLILFATEATVARRQIPRTVAEPTLGAAPLVGYSCCYCTWLSSYTAGFVGCCR